MGWMDGRFSFSSPPSYFVRKLGHARGDRKVGGGAEAGGQGGGRVRHERDRQAGCRAWREREGGRPGFGGGRQAQARPLFRLPTGGALSRPAPAGVRLVGLVAERAWVVGRGRGAQGEDAAAPLSRHWSKQEKKK